LGRDVQVHGFASPAFVHTSGNNWLTLYSNRFRIEPEYLETLHRFYIGGSVRMAVTVSARGSVENVELLGGNSVLAEAATTTAGQ
jgi:hypothetical protein